MTQIYMDWTPVTGEPLDSRLNKLYLGIISVGEELYSLGSSVAEVNKRCNALEPKVTQLRRELEAIKAELRAGEAAPPKVGR